MTGSPAVVAGYARTPFARWLGALGTVPATTLGAAAITAALSRAGVAPGDVGAVVGGQALQAAAGQNPARQAAVGAGIPLTVPAWTLNAVCLSGLEAVVQADRLIRTGEHDVVVAVGQESMSSAPHALPGSRRGTPFGATEFVDLVQHDGLRDAFDGRAMGEAADAVNADLGIDRAAQDEWAARSHQRAAASRDLLAEEVVPVAVPGRRGTTTVGEDDGVRDDTTLEALSRLRPAFAPTGTVTAGNASQLTDGAAALVLVSARYAQRAGVRRLAEVVAHATVAGPDTTLHAQPANALRAALERSGTATADLRHVELNEAFAAVALHSTRLLGLDHAVVNPHGGAVALGHPLGASGARIAGHLALRLHRGGPGHHGAASLCGGGGQGTALVLRSV
ncbi:acetyl-CoA C-acyltransferase [Kineococcus auxinigenes]|uniref:acetyl-CoA C-acyltransferase n=1 Tax=unclassified Kineococcus TaxID=2621656 RepID=UPI003D7DAA6C